MCERKLSPEESIAHSQRKSMNGQVVAKDGARHLWWITRGSLQIARKKSSSPSKL